MASLLQAKVVRLLLAFTAFLYLPRGVHAAGVVTTNTEAALVAAMAGGGTVSFGFDGTIYLTNTLLVTNTMIIDGTGHSVTISGSNAVQIMSIAANFRLVLSNLTLANGWASVSGGAISNLGILQAYGCMFASNTEVIGIGPNDTEGPNGDGGAIYNSSILTLNNCTFASNTVTGTGNVYGGAIYNSGTMTANSCTFASNAVVTPVNGCGGAIYNTNSMTLNNCSFASNSAKGLILFAQPDVCFDCGTSYGGAGGAIYNNSSMTLSNCTFTGNSTAGGAGPEIFDAPDANGGFAFGGAIYNLEQGTVIDCVFSNNSAVGGMGGTGVEGPDSGGIGGAACGGAIWSSSQLGLTNNTFTYNSVLGGVGNQGGMGNGGGYTGFVGGNGGMAGGGAVCFTGGPGTISGCTFLSNNAVGQMGGEAGPGANGYDSGVNGGNGGTGGAGGLGIGGGIAQLGGTNSIINSTLCGNFAQGGPGGQGGQGGAAFENFYSEAGNGGNGGNGGSGSGGALGILGGVIAVTNVTMASNSVATSPGGGAGPSGGMGGSAGNNGAAGAKQGGEIGNAGGTNILLNSILAQNAPGDTNLFGPIIDAGYNISFDNQHSLTNTHSYNGVNPLLAPLGNNGGPTETMALLTGSPAIDQADPASYPPIDQRGNQRPWGHGPDIGAFEYSLDNVLFIDGRGAGTMTLGFGGTNNESYRIETSADLIHWVPVQTNSFGRSVYLDTTVSITNPHAQFFRAVTP